jgi:hypothetical protein
MVALVLAVTGASAGGFAGVLERRSISRPMSFVGSSERTRGITSKSLTGRRRRHEPLQPLPFRDGVLEREIERLTVTGRSSRCACTA